MSLADRLDDFISANGDDVFIEVEGRYRPVRNFIRKYNDMYDPTIDEDSDGVRILGDVDKWGIELRLYLHDIPNDVYAEESDAYRPEYSYRISNNRLIWDLFDRGYRIGYN